MGLCDEVDLLLAEPSLVRSCRAVGSELWAGQVVVSGVEARNASVSWDDQGVQSGMLVFAPASQRTGMVTATIEGGFVCVVPTRDTRLGTRALPTLSGGQSGLGDSAALDVSFWSFPQISAAEQVVRAELGVPQTLTVEYFDAERLVRTTVLLSLSMIFRSMAAMDRTVVTSEDTYQAAFIYNTPFRRLGEWYEKAYERELRRVRVSLDADADGRRERVVGPSDTKLVRE